MKALFTFLALFLTCVSAHALPSQIEEIAHLRETADSMHSVGRTDSASIVCNQAIKLAHKSGDFTQIVGTHSSQGVFLRSLGQIDEALKHYEAALEIVTSPDFRKNPGQEAIEETAALYINIATLNIDMQHKDEAAKNARLAGEWIAKSNDPDFRSMAYGAAGSVLTGCGDLKTAMQFQDEAYKDAMATDNKDTAFRSAAYTMLIADRMGDKENAQSWREKCTLLLPEIQSTMSLLIYYQAECSICLKNHNPKGALVFFDKILNLDGISNLPFVVFDCYNNMHMAYAELGDYKDAYDILLKNNELRDSLWEQEKTENLRDLTIKYETKETELALAHSEARRANTLMWLLAAAVALLLCIVAFVIYVSHQRRKRMAREMEFANLRADIGRKLTEQYIEGLETERERMARELHDGVCNDMLAIQMNMSKGASSADTARLIDSCRESVRRISHELMPPEFSYADIDEVIRYYIAKQREVYGGKMHLSYSSGSDEGWNVVPDDMALEIYRIVQEAVGNSLKHSGADNIDVSMTLNQHRLTLAIADNGIYSPSGRRGIGLNSMKRRAAAIGGNLAINISDSGNIDLILTVEIH